tara:strand:+ start:355 stop:489 length:135 start_codon:yes stop_codon:yes gene_type:complete
MSNNLFHTLIILITDPKTKLALYPELTSQIKKGSKNIDKLITVT